MMITVNEVNNNKTKVLNEFIFVVFRSFVLLPNSMSKLIHNPDVLVLKLIIKTMPARVYATVNTFRAVLKTSGTAYFFSYMNLPTRK